MVRSLLEMVRSEQVEAELQALQATSSQHVQSLFLCRLAEPCSWFCCGAVRRFADCMHLAEPGCSVTAAELERHEHYIKFLAEVKVCHMDFRDGVA